jgi:CRISPR system Cascade subunit CasB
VSEATTDSFFKFLEGLDPGGRAILRRSLSCPPGTWPASFPYVEPWVRNRYPWERSMAYLVAGLSAASRGSAGADDLGRAVAKLRSSTGSGSVESRFIALLDADAEQLPHRLRQMTTLMSSHGIAPDWARLRRDLDRWLHPDRIVQQRWARSFYADDARGDQAGTDGNETDVSHNSGEDRPV